jgi:hypothetical protein
VVAKGRRRKSATYGEGCSFYSRWRRLANGGARLWVARAVAVVKPWAAEWRQPRSECGWHGGAVVQTVWLTSGAHAVSYFPELSKLAQTLKLKMDALPCSKNSQFCMSLDWRIMNNFLNCADIQFSIELELKIRKQIQHLNL